MALGPLPGGTCPQASLSFWLMPDLEVMAGRTSAPRERVINREVVTMVQRLQLKGHVYRAAQDYHGACKEYFAALAAGESKPEVERALGNCYDTGAAYGAALKALIEHLAQMAPSGTGS